MTKRTLSYMNEFIQLPLLIKYIHFVYYGPVYNHSNPKWPIQGYIK